MPGIFSINELIIAHNIFYLMGLKDFKDMIT
jgi:hypothetical protein